MLPKIGTDSFGMMVRRSTSRYRTVSWLNHEQRSRGAGGGAGFLS